MPPEMYAATSPLCASLHALAAGSVAWSVVPSPASALTVLLDFLPPGVAAHSVASAPVPTHLAPPGNCRRDARLCRAPHMRPTSLPFQRLPGPNSAQSSRGEL